MRVHHVGYLVKRMDRALKMFQNLGYHSVSDAVYDEYRDINILFLEKDGYCVELVQPVSERSVVYNLLKKNGSTPYHICYCVDHISDGAKVLREQGFVPMGEEAPAPAIDNCLAGFYYHRDMGIVELIEHN